MGSVTNNNDNAAGCSRLGPPRLVVEGGLQLFSPPTSSTSLGRGPICLHPDVIMELLIIIDVISD